MTAERGQVYTRADRDLFIAAINKQVAELRRSLPPERLLVYPDESGGA